MAQTYVFSNMDSSQVIRSDSAHIPWDTENNCPLDMGGLVGRVWQADGSPVPSAYVAPPATVPETISQRQFMQQLATEGDITWDEAKAYLASGAPFAMVTNNESESYEIIGCSLLPVAMRTYPTGYCYSPNSGAIAKCYNYNTTADVNAYIYATPISVVVRLSGVSVTGTNNLAVFYKLDSRM